MNADGPLLSSPMSAMGRKQTLATSYLSGRSSAMALTIDRQQSETPGLTYLAAGGVQRPGVEPGTLTPSG